jgi:hypothetical protein
MPQYRCLQDCFVNGAYNNAGDVITFAGVPGPYLDPLDTPALNAFYAAFPQSAGLIRAQWSGVPVNPPTTYWRPTSLAASGLTSWQLTGLGSNLPAIVI